MSLFAGTRLVSYEIARAYGLILKSCIVAKPASENRRTGTSFSIEG
jgi:hypothetical protein